MFSQKFRVTASIQLHEIGFMEPTQGTYIKRVKKTCTLTVTFFNYQVLTVSPIEKVESCQAHAGLIKVKGANGYDQSPMRN